MHNKFVRYLEERNDEIDNAAYALACALFHGDEELEWGMHYIGEIVEWAEDVMYSYGLSTCHPYYSSELPCYLSGECSLNCRFKRGASKDD